MSYLSESLNRLPFCTLLLQDLSLTRIDAHTEF